MTPSCRRRAAARHGRPRREGAVVRDALLWNDTRSARGRAIWSRNWAAPRLGHRRGQRAHGLVHRHQVALAGRARAGQRRPYRAVLLPHDWLTWRLGGTALAAITTDRGDASGTGYWSPATGAYRADCSSRRSGGSSRCRGSPGPVSARRDALGRRARRRDGRQHGRRARPRPYPGDVVVSHRHLAAPSSAVAETPTADASGAVAGFADATGRFLPLVCTLNAARVLDRRGHYARRRPWGFGAGAAAPSRAPAG